MVEIDQSIVRPSVWYVRINGVTITTDEKSVRELLRSGMSTVIGKAMLKDFIKRINNKQ